MKKIYLLLASLLSGSLAAQAQSVNYGVQFNGTSQYGYTASSLNLNGSSLSLEGWVRFNSFKIITPFISSIIGLESTSGVGDVALLRTGDVGQPANQLQFVLKLGTTAVKLSSTTQLSANTWYHVAGVYDGSSMKIYLNGVLDCSMPATGTVAATGIFNIGRTYEAVRTLDGALDEVRVWTRALTAAEVLANRCQPGSNSTGLRAWWRLDDRTTTAYDQSGYNSNLTVLGTWITTTPALCDRSLATTAAAASEGVRLLPTNPTAGSTVEAELRGAAGQFVRVEVLNAVGQLVGTHALRPSTDAERVTLPLPGAAGLYVLRTSTASGSTSTRLVKL